ncbi:hypothetical protein BDA96_06G291200 [Sorghum bicolor]|uniref:Uncharacterized protein n=1 Tax=Sorghum bicolor TaxID=4558 RepID=A0A921QWJ5_SORBI|nr:hypothetical protein BDA96_06G291200 [Sorghum bicolor]
MSRSCCLAVSVLLAIAATSSATLPALLHEEHLEEATATGLLVAEGASTWVANKVSPAQPLEARPSGGMATQGDDQSSSGGSSSSSSGGEHGKEEGGSKEGEKQGKSCLTKEECHKKKMLCGKGCTLSAHSKCAAKCTKSCVPTC